MITSPALKAYPSLLVKPREDIPSQYKKIIQLSDVSRFSPKTEIWTIEASNKELAYLSHGIFRYFGKFPPPIAKHLISQYTKEGELVIDLMCGSGTTAVEAVISKRRAYCFDVNPLAVLISKVKVTKISAGEFKNALAEVLRRTPKQKVTNPQIVGLKNPQHWFLNETIVSLEKIKKAIEKVDATPEVKNVLWVAFLGIVRRVSRATTQQGRLFLDVTTAEKDALPFFEKKALQIFNSLEEIPKVKKRDVIIKKKSILEKPTDSIKEKSSLIICHPPYFNAYKYSGVNSLELAWLGIDHANVRKDEVREFFKVGKSEKVTDYIDDMETVLRNLAEITNKGGRVALMIGDTTIKGSYIPVTKMVAERITDIYRIEKTALRIPKFTEASWAASQRRNGKDVGINLCDFVVILNKK